MTSDEIIGSYGLRVISEPMPKQIERGMMDAELELRAAAAWFARVFPGREARSAHADSAAKPAPTV
jgi:hypothetical protein